MVQGTMCTGAQMGTDDEWDLGSRILHVARLCPFNWNRSPVTPGLLNADVTMSKP